MGPQDLLLPLGDVIEESHAEGAGPGAALRAVPGSVGDEQGRRGIERRQARRHIPEQTPLLDGQFRRCVHPVDTANPASGRDEVEQAGGIIRMEAAGGDDRLDVAGQMPE